LSNTIPNQPFLSRGELKRKVARRSVLRIRNGSTLRRHMCLSVAGPEWRGAPQPVIDNYIKQHTTSGGKGNV